MNYKIAICDDERYFIEKIRAVLFDFEMDTYTDPKLLFDAVQSGKEYDVLFLDIIMPGFDGISLARELREISEDMIIVFITGTIEFMQTGYEVKAFRYLLKEQVPEGLICIWRDIETELETKKNEFFTYEFERRTYHYRWREIGYFESSLRRVTLHTKTGTGTGTFYGNLDDIAAANPLFVRIHKSFLVNRRHIRSISADTVIVDNGEILPVSRKYKANLEAVK